ncbi:MAG: hypothetical protein OHK0044_30100 [Burkholderiaceae bacterium]
MAVCASIPADAAVVEVTPQARYEGDDADWNDRRAAAGSRSGFVRFGERPFERAESAAARQVCLDVWSWDSRRTLDARLLVKYLPADRPRIESGASGAAPVQASIAH